MACYQRATYCTNGPQPGALGLMDAILDTVAETKTWGIFNCRSVNTPGGSSSLSVHSQGRAGDTAGPFPALQKAFDKLLPVADELDLQFLIFNRRKYGCATEWTSEPYGGYAHVDHIHWELNWTGAKVSRDVMYYKALGLLGGVDLTPEESKRLERVEGLLDKLVRVVGSDLYPNKKGVLASLTKQVKSEDGTSYVEAVDYFADLITAQLADQEKRLIRIESKLGP